MGMTFVTIVFILALSIENGYPALNSCDNKIYCVGPLIYHVSRYNISGDSKSFVDMKLKISPEEVISQFEILLKLTDNNPSKGVIERFVNENFEPGDELEDWTPPDFNPHPSFLKKIKDDTIKKFASNLVQIWPTLGRKIKADVKKNPDRHSLITLPNGFIIPGGRFKEIYYWDTYWIIEGLLISEMTETVKGILENFSSLVKRFGYIPNGNRIYYLDRSQPPLFTQMVYKYVEKTKDVEFLEQHLALMDAEIMYWLNEKTVQVNIDGQIYTLAQYHSGSKTPRPESYHEDLVTCEVHSEEDKPRCYNELHTGAESGWDFSSRWIFDKAGGHNANLSYIEPTRLIQVDLNSILCKNFRILRDFYQVLGKENKAAFWATKEKLWKIAIEKVLYDKETGVWFDYDMKLNKHRKFFYTSNFAPLAAEILKPEVAKERGCTIAKYIKSQGIEKYTGGVPTSLVNQTGQQWDLPNAWPPSQDDIITALVSSNCPEAIDLAMVLTKNWVNSMILGYQRNGQMFEKYNALVPGERGGGGEYAVQKGFGWTNGVALRLIDSFYTQ